VDLYLLSYLVQHGRYRVAPELVAEALMRHLIPDLRPPDTPDEPVRLSTPTAPEPAPWADAGP
jgi:hypothetical protein